MLSRYYDAAKKYEVNTIVRITADCPLIDPAVIDRTIELFQKNNLDYVVNTVPTELSKFPDGSDVEVFSMQAMERANQEATSKEDREHVTFYFWKSEKKDTFKIAQLGNHENWSKYRFTVDYPEDLIVCRAVYAKFKEKAPMIPLIDAIQFLDNNESLKKLVAPFCEDGYSTMYL